MNPDTKITLCVTGCDDWLGYAFVAGLNNGAGRQHVRRIYAGVIDENRQYTQWLKNEPNVEVFSYDENRTDKLDHYCKEADAVVIVPTPIHHEQYLGDGDGNQDSRHKDVPPSVRAVLESMRQNHVHCASLVSYVNVDQAKGPHLAQIAATERAFVKCMKSTRKFTVGDIGFAEGGRYVGCGQIIRASLPMEHLYLFQDVIRDDQAITLPVTDQEFVPVTMMDVTEGLVNLIYRNLHPPSHHNEALPPSWALGQPTGHQSAATFPGYETGSTGFHHADCGCGDGDKDKHRIINFTGPKSLTGSRLAEEASHALGIHYDFRVIKLDDMRSYLMQKGLLRDAEAACLVELYEELVIPGRMAKVIPDLQHALDRKPSGAAAFWKFNGNDFKPKH
ncbi:hypothetical protein IWQ60_007646 [Tieghemiomyces parasiticus]|uniref:Uncharacterized protein n=1 Tax=Tieghemiomyces parasiticus TaxID=78921 RepID=A0A9W8DU45_9FUNG|nr:hypothetical protein IWQ60_007646 [Tieghemiomyces parasiticus]